MATYILESQGYIKIGWTNNLKVRTKTYDTHNPSFSFLKTIDEDYEDVLQYLFKDKVYKNEWFALSEEDKKYLLSEEILEKCKILNKYGRGNYSICTEFHEKNIGEIKTQEDKLSKVKGILGIVETSLRSC